jgi:GNAT superfamily N-acetyltransferase
MTAIRSIADHYGNLSEWPRRPDYLDFELAERSLWVAQDGGDQVAGYAGVIERSGVAHLADLFVDPDRRAAGTGQALLAGALPRDGTRITFASSDPRAMPLYVRSGMRPIAPVLYMTGDRAAAGRLDTPAHHLDRVGVPDLLHDDARASGRERPADLDFLHGAGAYGVRAPGSGGWAIVRPMDEGAWLGSADAGAAEVLAFAAAAAADHGKVKLAVCGPHPSVAPLIEAGFRIDSVDTLMMSRPDALDTRRYLPSIELG